MPNFEDPQKNNSPEEDAESLVKGMMGEDAFEKEGVDRPEDSWKDKQGKEENSQEAESKIPSRLLKKFNLAIESIDIPEEKRQEFRDKFINKASNKPQKETKAILGRVLLEAQKEKKQSKQETEDPGQDDKPENDISKQEQGSIEEKDDSSELQQEKEQEQKSDEKEADPGFPDQEQGRESKREELKKKREESKGKDYKNREENEFNKRVKEGEEIKEKEEKDVEEIRVKQEEKEKKGQEQEKKEISDKVAERFETEMNIKKEELEGLEGFNELSEGQQFLVLENLKQLALGRIEDEASDEFKKDIKTSKFLGKLWKGMTKHYHLGKLQEGKGEEILSGGIKTHEQTLKQLVNGLKEFGPEVEVKGDGSLEINFLNIEEDLDKDKKEKLEYFNRIANEFARIPEEWKHSSSRSDRNKFEKTQQQYEQTLKEVLNIKRELKGEQEACLEAQKAAFQVYANQLLSNNPEAEKALENIDNQKAWKNSLKDIFTEKGVMFGGGFVARSGATALLGAVGSSLAAFGAPLGAAGIGGYRGWKRTQEELAEQDKEARRGSSEKDDYKYYVEQEVGTKKDVVEWNYYSESLKDLEGILEDEGSSAEQKQEALKSLYYHIDEIISKIEKGEIDFGTDKERFYNQYSLVQELGQALACEAQYNYLNSGELDEKYKEDREVVDEFVGNLENSVEDNRKKYARGKALQSAATSAGFAFAGQWLGGKFAEHMGWDQGEVMAQEQAEAGSQEKVSSEFPKETPEQESIRSEETSSKPEPPEDTVKEILEKDRSFESKIDENVWKLKEEKIKKIMDSSISDPELVNIIGEDGKVADWEIKVGESELPREIKLKFLQDKDLGASLEADPSSVEKLEGVDSKLLDKIIKNGAVSETDIKVARAELSPEVKNELLDLSDSEKENYLQYLDKLKDVDDKALSLVKDQNLTELKDYAGAVNSLAHTVEQGDNITTAARKLLEGNNASNEVKDAFIDNYYPDHDDITDNNREELLEQAINKMSASNLKMGDGDDLKNLIYEGNEIHINSETGEIYVKKGDSELEARAVSERALRESWADQRARELGLDPEKVDFGSNELGEKELSTTVEVNGESHEVAIDENNNWTAQVEGKEMTGKFQKGDSLASIKEEIRSAGGKAEAIEIMKGHLDPDKPSQLKPLQKWGINPENGLTEAERQKLEFLNELSENNKNWNEASRIFYFVDEIKDTKLSGLFGHTVEDYHKLQDLFNQINYESFQGSEGDRYLRELASIRFNSIEGAEKSATHLFYEVIGHFDLEDVELTRPSEGVTKISLPHDNWGPIPDSDWEITINWQEGKMNSNGPALRGKEGDISKDTLERIMDNIDNYFNSDHSTEGTEAERPGGSSSESEDASKDPDSGSKSPEKATSETEQTGETKEGSREAQKKDEEKVTSEEGEFKEWTKEPFSEKQTAESADSEFKHESGADILDKHEVKGEPRSLLNSSNPEAVDAYERGGNPVAGFLKTILKHQEVLESLKEKGQTGTQEYDWILESYKNKIDVMEKGYPGFLDKDKVYPDKF